MKTFEIRYEEIPTVAKFTEDTFVVDQTAFENFSDDYKPPFLADLTAKRTAAEAVVSTHFYIKVIEQITINIMKGIRGLRPMMRKLKRYVEKAEKDTGLTPKQFGVLAVMHEIDRKDVERLNTRMKELFENVDLYNQKLEDRGFTPALYTDLKNAKTALFDLNADQNAKENEKAIAVNQNKALFEELRAIIVDLHKTGKAIFKDTDDTRVHNMYTMQTILNRIRQETSEEQKEIKKIEEDCGVYVKYEDEQGAPLPDVTTTVVEYNLVVESEGDEDEAVSYFESVPTKPYNKVTIKSEHPDYVMDLQNEVALTAGGEVEVTVVMKKVV